MFVNYRGSVFSLLAWEWRSLVVFGVLATPIVALDRLLDWHWFEVTALPLGVLGGAIGIFVSFRTNSAYDRWWEGRRLWGQLVNTSRHFATQVLTFVDSQGQSKAQRAAKHALVQRQIAYVHVLRCVLRNQDPFADEEVVRWLDPAELEAARSESNLNHALLHRQSEELVRLTDGGHVDTFRLQSIDRTIATLLDVQGGCERIKRTPFPPGYGYLASRLIYAYAILMPLGIVADVGWAAIPLTMLVCIGFTLISDVGRVLEDPFTMFWPALPLSALSRTIEINLRQRLGEHELPPMLQPNARGILM